MIFCLPLSPRSPAPWACLALLLTVVCAPAMAVDSGALRFGVFPRWNAQVLVRDFGPLAQILGEALQREVRIETDKDFDTFMQRVYARQFELVHLNQLQYLRAHQQAGYQAIAGLCESPDCTIRALIVTRTDSGLREVGELRGKTVAFGGRDAMVSHVLARQLLREHGLPPADYRALFAPNPPNALLTVYNGAADAAGIGTGVLQRPEITRRIEVEQLRVLARSAPIPPLPLAVRADLDPQLVRRLQDALIAVSRSDAGRAALARIGASHLAPAAHADYTVLQPLTEQADHVAP